MNAMKRSDVVGGGGARFNYENHDGPGRQANTTTTTTTTTKTSSPVGRQEKQQAPSEIREQKQAQLLSASQPPAEASCSSPANSKLVFGLNSRTNRVKHDEYAEQRRHQQTKLIEQHQKSQDSSAQQNKSGEQVQATPTKPKTLRAAPSKHESSESGKQQAEVTSGISNNQQGDSVKKDSNCQLPDNKEATGCASAPSAASRRAHLVDQSSKTTRGPKKMARRKSIEEDLSTSKIESCPSTGNNSIEAAAAAAANNQQFKMRTQFNILPPPQLTMATSGKGSVVSYAKSRIYDKPTSKELLQSSAKRSQMVGSSNSLLDDATGVIPASILSGFKPPKQVNVSKARKEWEGGEPFAKCKSRQRLAAKAAAAGQKKLLHGTWSMTSVVATQQLQLQQALAASSASVRSNVEQSDPSVKVLTRGSVLERIQQYERAPMSSSSARSRSSSGSSLLAGQSGEPTDEQQSIGLMGQLDSTTTTTPHTKQAQYRTRIASIQQEQQHLVAEATLITPTTAATTTTTTTSNQIKAQPQQQLQRQQQPPPPRRLSLRRASSSTSNSSTQLIPKFYHPNGKPNTYEMELQKKNIVACFEKLPDRKGQLAGPNWKRHFHSIALACGFSEYFKMPLNLYVRHCMQNFSSLTSSINNSHSRRSSLVCMTNGSSSSPLEVSKMNSRSEALKKDNTGKLMRRRTSSIAMNQPNLKPGLTKAASIDSSTGKMEAKSQHQNGSGDENCSQPVTYITCEQFLVVWRHLIEHAYDLAAKFIHLLTFGQRSHLLPDDFVPLVQSIIDDHPGLKFLRAAPDFHLRYIQTVIARIYYNINRSWTGKISANELRRSNLFAVLLVLSQEEDINQITDYFSYEHFYVIYCKFWNLDQDHDLLISKEDLARHNDASISSRIIERIFSASIVVSTNSLIRQTGKMGYSDFVWFLLAEEDKKHPRSIEYWFRLMDLDGDGYISIYEMEYFYYEQWKRLELMNIEPLPFLDCACQILDLVNPKEKSKISLADLKQSKMAPIFFDTFINLEKYLEHESREFVSTRDLIQDGVLISDWDRYASEEYENLVTEESSV